MKRAIILATTHLITLVAGFGLGVYFLPILTAPASPDEAVLQEAASSAQYSGEFTRDLPGSDALHWGEGTISVTPEQLVHTGELSPGPDYKVYLTTQFVDDERGFEAIKDDAFYVGDVKSFDGFLLDLPRGVDIEAYDTVVVWCESFGEFITAARYR